MIIMHPTGYCKGAVHSVAADFNGGALECDCNDEGTEAGQTESCAKMGGQCTCKPNVIGRQCTKCKPDFFGFPNCKQGSKLEVKSSEFYGLNQVQNHTYATMP